MRERILVSWIGHADLRSMAESLTEKQQAKLWEIIGQSKPLTGSGPVKALVKAREFAEIHLLSSYPASTNRQFAKWLGHQVTMHPVSEGDPTDHGRILRCVQPVLDSIVIQPQQELCFHLSPGTPAMASIWLLLAKSKYPATLFQTYNDRVTEADIPFDVTVDVVPQLLRDPDRYWEHLSSEGPSETFGFSDIAGNSKPIRVATGRAKRAALFDVTVLILGESGTGKEMFASAIHNASHRRDKPFVAINCAAISRELLESELFGHVKGAFTGADSNRAGAFEQADGGTLFLDEVGECDLSMQAKILRLLQPPHGAEPSTRVFRRVGSTKDQTANVRVIAATNRNLGEEIAKGRFREDLYYRLATITLKLPPLRQRDGDIPVIAKTLLKQVNEQFQSSKRPGYQPKTLTPDTLSYMSKQPWRGNVRELYNSLVQACVMQDGTTLMPEDIAAAAFDIPLETNGEEPGLGDGFSIDDHLAEIQRRYIEKAMKQAGGVKTRAAKLLGLSSYQTLDNRLERLSD